MTTARLPYDIEQKLEAASKAQGKPKSEFIREALVSAVNAGFFPGHKDILPQPPFSHNIAPPRPQDKRPNTEYGVESEE